MGIVYSNLTRTHEKLYPLLLSAEKPLYIVLLVLIGALWVFRFDWIIVFLVLVLITARVIGYTLPLPFCRFLLRFPFPLPPVFGLSFLSVGGVGMALAVSLELAYPMMLTDVFLSVALLAAILSEFLSPKALKIAVKRLDPLEKK